MDDNQLPISWDRNTGFTIRPTGDAEEATPAVDVPEAPRGRRTRPQREESQFDGDLKQDDLLEYENLNTIRAYMTDIKGTQYRDMEPEEVVDDFVEHMRYFNTNLVSTGGVVRYISQASDEQKARAAQAYQLYDRLGNVFVNDGFFGAVEGIGDYITAAATDPSNYIGLLTGGISKVGSMGITAGSRALVRQAMREASERAIASGATREAAEQAAQRAASRTIQRLTQRGVTNNTAERLAQRVATQERDLFFRRAGAEAEQAVLDPLQRRAGRMALYGTTALDGTFAALNDYQIQNVMLDVGVQEEYSRTQTALSSLFGLVGGGVQLAGRQASGVSGLGGTRIRLDEAATRAEQESLVRNALTPEEVDTAVQTIDDVVSTWSEKVQRGRETFGENSAPVEVLYEIMLGKDGKGGGIADLMRSKGIRITRNRTVSDVMTEFVRQLPQEKLADINAKLEPMTGLTLGETTGLGMRLSDLFAKDINVAGRTLNVMSQVKKTINASVMDGNNMLDTLARQDEILDRVNAEMGKITKARKVGQYTQSLWRRLLVSSPATSMVNVAGYAQFSTGQTLADLFNAGTLSLYGLARGGKLTKAGRESLQMARVYTTIQAQKMRNFADPFTTHDAYMDLLNRPEAEQLQRRLFESFTGGVDRNIKRYNLDPNSKAVKVTESVTEAANVLTGVRIQDTFTKSQMFMTELDKNLRLVKNQTLDEALSSGLIDDILDDDVLNPTLDTTLKSVYSKDYTTDDQGLLGDVAKLIEKVSSTPVIGTVLPFGRFLNNTVATAYQWSFLSILPAAARLSKRSADAGEKIMAREALARSLVGTAALAAAWEFDQDRLDKGLAYNEIETAGGTIIDARNTFPFSLFLVMGRMANLKSRGQAIPEELSVEFGTQVGVGQAATDLQFGNDMVAVYDALFNVGSDEQGYADLMKGLMRGLGNYTAGYTRPLDAVNKLVGYIHNTDAARDLRQAEGAELFTQASTRYLDNIFEAMFDKVDSITGEELRVASREGPLYDANPMARIFGITVRPSRTATEQAYSMSNMAEWTASERSNIPEYDRIFNSTIAPQLEQEMERLIRDERFVNGDTRTRKLMLNNRLSRIRSQTRQLLNIGTGGEGSQESVILSLRRRASRHGTKGQRDSAIEAMRENFNFSGDGVRDMSIRELQYFMNYVDYLDLEYQ